jgi:hypothetical protein
MITFIIHFARMKFQYVRGTGHYAKVASLAPLPVHDHGSFYFRHNEISFSYEGAKIAFFGEWRMIPGCMGAFQMVAAPGKGCLQAAL